MNRVVLEITPWSTVRRRDCNMEVRLTAMELRILRGLLRARKGHCTRYDILSEMHANEADQPEPHVVNAHILKMRRKLDEIHAGDAIKTVYGLGYALDSDRFELLEADHTIGLPLPIRLEREAREAASEAGETLSDFILGAVRQRIARGP